MKWKVRHNVMGGGECKPIDVNHIITNEKEEVLVIVPAYKNSRYDIELMAKAPELFEALKGLISMTEDSSGVAGYHLNGEVAEWNEFEEYHEALRVNNELVERIDECEIRKVLANK